MSTRGGFFGSRVDRTKKDDDSRKIKAVRKSSQYHLPIPKPGAQNILNYNPASKMTEKELNLLRKKHKIPTTVLMRLPQGEERADWMIPGWSTVYLKPFEYGFKLPISGLLKSFCEYEMMNPSQLLPNSLKKIFGIQKLAEMNGVEWDPVDFFQIYYLRPQDCEPGRFLLVTNRRSEDIILNLPKTGCWRDKYFFVSGDWIRGGSDKIPHFFNPNPLYVKKKQCYPGHLSDIRVELLLNAKFRSWKKLVIKINEKTQGDKECEVKDKSNKYNVQKSKRRVPEHECRTSPNKRPRFEPDSDSPDDSDSNISAPDSSSLKNEKSYLEYRLSKKVQKLRLRLETSEKVASADKKRIKALEIEVKRLKGKEQELINKVVQKELDLTNREKRIKEDAALASDKRIRDLETEVNGLKEKEQELIAELEKKKQELANRENASANDKRIREELKMEINQLKKKEQELIAAVLEHKEKQKDEFYDNGLTENFSEVRLAKDLLKDR